LIISFPLSKQSLPEEFFLVLAKISGPLSGLIGLPSLRSKGAHSGYVNL